jgi:hypothetical protein
MVFTSKTDKRNTSNGMTPNKSIKRKAAPAPKKMAKMVGRGKGK